MFLKPKSYDENMESTIDICVCVYILIIIIYNTIFYNQLEKIKYKQIYKCIYIVRYDLDILHYKYMIFAYLHKIYICKHINALYYIYFRYVQFYI